MQDKTLNQNFIKRFILVVNVAVLVMSFVALNVALAQECKLNVGWDSWKPYQYINENNELKGFDIELITAVLNNMGCKLNLDQMPWKRLLREVKNGRIDIAAGVTITAERKQWGYFSKHYREETRVLFVLAESFEKYKLNSLKDIIDSDFQLGVNRGAHNGEYFETLMNDPKFRKHVQFVTSEEQNIKKLRAKNRTNGFIGDLISGKILLRENNMLDEVSIYPMNIYSTDIYFLFSKKTLNKEFVERFNYSLALLKKNGVYETISQKYFQ